MNGYGKLETLVMCLSQLLALKIHNNLRNKITKEICNPPYVYLPTLENFTPPYTSPDVAQTSLSDWFWAPLLYKHHICVFTIINCMKMEA